MDAENFRAERGPVGPSGTSRSSRELFLTRKLAISGGPADGIADPLSRLVEALRPMDGPVWTFEVHDWGFKAAVAPSPQAKMIRVCRVPKAGESEDAELCPASDDEPRHYAVVGWGDDGLLLFNQDAEATWFSPQGTNEMRAFLEEKGLRLPTLQAA